MRLRNTYNRSDENFVGMEVLFFASFHTASVTYLMLYQG